MRTLPAAQEAHLAKITGAPFQAALVKIFFTAQTLLLTNADGDITITGDGTYLSTRMVSRIGAVRDGSEITGAQQLPNEDQAYSNIIEAEGWSEKPYELRVVSGGPGTYALDEAPRVFRGYTSDYEDRINTLLFGLVETNSSDAFTGRVTIDEVFKHAPVPGTIVAGANVIWTIQRGAE